MKKLWILLNQPLVILALASVVYIFGSSIPAWAQLRYQKDEQNDRKRHIAWSNYQIAEEAELIEKIKFHEVQLFRDKATEWETIVGYVENTSETVVRDIEFYAAYLSKDGDLLDAERVYTGNIKFLYPGQKIPFDNSRNLKEFVTVEASAENPFGYIETPRPPAVSVKVYVIGLTPVDLEDMKEFQAADPVDGGQ